MNASLAHSLNYRKYLVMVAIIAGQSPGDCGTQNNGIFISHPLESVCFLHSKRDFADVTKLGY
jgi:hypothetical protein